MEGGRGGDPQPGDARTDDPNVTTRNRRGHSSLDEDTSTSARQRQETIEEEEDIAPTTPMASEALCMALARQAPP